MYSTHVTRSRIASRALGASPSSPAVSGQTLSTSVHEHHWPHGPGDADAGPNKTMSSASISRVSTTPVTEQRQAPSASPVSMYDHVSAGVPVEMSFTCAWFTLVTYPDGDVIVCAIDEGSAGSPS